MITEKASRNPVVYKCVPCDKNVTCSLLFIFVFLLSFKKDPLGGSGEDAGKSDRMAC